MREREREYRQEVLAEVPQGAEKKRKGGEMAERETEREGEKERGRERERM